MLDIYIDFKSPAAYLALAPTLALIDRLNVSVRWYPYRTTQQAVPPKLESETVGQRHRRVRAQARQATHLKYAALRGLDMQFPKTPGNCDLALSILLDVTADPRTFITAAFKAYWVDGVDLNDPAMMAALSVATSMPKIDNLADASTRLDAAQNEAEARGIVEAPAYVIGEHLFIGREHLPWIEDLLVSAN